MNRLIVVVGPSAVGKTHLANLLTSRFPRSIAQGQLYTTRQPRPGEIGADRLFISPEEFKLRQADEFFIAEKFHDSWYGYPKSLLDNSDKHLIINAWPALIPRFADIPQALILGMYTTDVDLLKSRMAERGYNEVQLNERLELIQKDQQDLLAFSSNIDSKGKLFQISGDNIIPEEIVPWLQQELGLKTEVGVA